MSSSEDKFVVIGNREIYDALMKLKGQVATLWVTNGLVTALLTAVLVKGVTG